MLPPPTDQSAAEPDRRIHLPASELVDAHAVDDLPQRGPVGLYAITPDIAEPDRLLALVKAALLGGIDALQFRVKAHAGEGDSPWRNQAARLSLAAEVKRLCDAHQVPLVINDDIELACELGARGVHIGRDDGDPIQARRRIGPTRWLGVSCYNDLNRALGLRSVADHVGFGSVYASPTKPAAVRAPLSLFAQAAAHGLHAVGIGGIDRSNAGQVIAAGAKAVAVISDLFSVPDPQRAAAALREQIRQAMDMRADRPHDHQG
jgi:thiamine-phosphate pyrophosphorylase